MFKKDIPEVPEWVSKSGDNTDSWFYQQLAKFATERINGSTNIVVSGQFVYSGGYDVLTFSAKPVALFSICPLNIGTGAPHSRGWFEGWTFSYQYNTIGPAYGLSIVPGTGLDVARVDNGNGTWSLDPNSWGFTNSTTDPDFYAVFLQT